MIGSCTASPGAAEVDWVTLTLAGGGFPDQSRRQVIARVVRVEPDPRRSDRSYAYVDGFLSFDEIVPMRRDGAFFEHRLETLPNRSKVGAALQGRSVRPISDEEFATITLAGLHGSLAPENAVRLELDRASVDAETLALVNAPLDEQKRRIEQILLNRKIRDASLPPASLRCIRGYVRRHGSAHDKRER